MPVLIFFGISKDADNLDKFEFELQDTISKVVGKLNLKTSEISCSFPIEKRSQGLGKKLYILVEGLSNKPERTKTVRNKLARTIVQVTHIYFPEAERIECRVLPFDPDQGYYLFS